ncbi:MAG: GNAT family N-acetyltransferase [Bacteroidota bacterium]
MLERSTYREFCRAAQVPVFARDWYLDSTCRDGQWAAAELYEGAQLIGIWPYYRKRKGPFRYLTLPPRTKFLGPYLLPEYRSAPECIQHYRALYRALPPFHSITQNCFYHLSTDQPFPIPQVQSQCFYSYRLDELDDLEALYAGFTRYYRNSILKKAPQKVTIRHDLGVDAYYEINRKTYARQGIPPPFSRAVLRSNMEALQRARAGRAFFAVDAEGQLHAAALLVWDERTAYYHSAGGDPALRKSGAGIYLVWAMIRYAVEELGLRHFDFAGSMIPAIEKIWLNFGAKKHTYYHFEKHDWLFQLAQRWKP